MKRIAPWITGVLGHAMLWTVGALLVVWLLWAAGFEADELGYSMAAAAASVKPYRWSLLGVRLVIWTAIAAQWRTIGRWLVPGEGEKAAEWQVAWMASRWRLMGAVALVEILIVISFVRG